MKRKKYIAEILLTSNRVSAESWQRLIFAVSSYIGILRKWKIIVRIDMNIIKYYIESPGELPTTVGDLSDFLLKKSELIPRPRFRWWLPMINHSNQSIIDVFDRNEVRYDHQLKDIEITIRPLGEQKYFSRTNLFFINHHRHLIKRKLYFNFVPEFLTEDFSSHGRFFYKKGPKYLDIEKSLHLLKSDQTGSILRVDTFPYLQGEYFLNQSNYNFDKHSIVIGSSGTGKSKLSSSLISNIALNPEYRLKYKVVVIDPHAAMTDDIGGLEKTTTLNFKTLEDSVDLFMNSSDDIIASSELILNLFESLIADQYNSKLERMLRFTIHLLLAKKEFTFLNMRKLLLDTLYRNQLVKEMEDIVPQSVTDFFLTDFNDLKTKSYSEAISPIISFIDEMQLIPVFNTNDKVNDISSTISDNFLTIFSLDRSSLGETVTKTIAGLVMQQIFQLIQSRTFNEHIIFVIDEVSSVETPIISRFLSEARKYNLSLLMAQQYFSQISELLKQSIFANVINYYVFRVSRIDAATLQENLMIKIACDSDKENKIKFLAGLNDRECVVRVGSNGVILPAFKAKTLDFVAKPAPKKIIEKSNNINQRINIKTISNPKPFSIGNAGSIRDLMKSQSTGRKDK